MRPSANVSTRPNFNIGEMSTDLMMPPVYLIFSPLRGTASLMLNEANTEVAAMKSVSSASILPGHTLQQVVTMYVSTRRRATCKV